MESSQYPSYQASKNFSDYYAVSEFERLSQRTSHKNKSADDNDSSSPREEIYKSLIKDIYSSTAPRLSSLIKKASGILRLSHLQPGDNDYPEFGSVPNSDSDFLHLKKIPQAWTQFDEEELRFRRLLEQEMALFAQNGGDFSDFETSTIFDSRSSSAQSDISRTSVSSSRTTKGQQERPPWRYFGNHKVLSTTSASSVSSVQSTGSSRIAAAYGQNSSTNSTPRSRISTAEVQKESKADYVKHVFVIKGQVVTFTGEGFESITNWFGDFALLKKVKASNGIFRRDLDLSGFSNQDICIKLYGGYKLVVEAYRPISNGLPPLRFKTTIVLPKGLCVEHLIMCRNPGGRLVIQESLPSMESRSLNYLN